MYNFTHTYNTYMVCIKSIEHDFVLTQLYSVQGRTFGLAGLDSLTLKTHHYAHREFFVQIRPNIFLSTPIECLSASGNVVKKQLNIELLDGIKLYVVLWKKVRRRFGTRCKNWVIVKCSRMGACTKRQFEIRSTKMAERVWIYNYQVYGTGSICT